MTSLRGRGKHSLQILVVQDRRSARRKLARLLEKNGYEVLGAGRAEEATAMARFQLFDLVIVDVSLPDSTGGALLRELRKSQPQARTIALGGPARNSEPAGSRQAGFHLHLARPFAARALLSAIANHCAPPGAFIASR
jgi:DNA-binding response OmpR family regulator